MHTTPENEVPTAPSSTRVAIVRSSYYAEMIDALEDEVRNILMQAGIPEGNIQSITVPGAFEIPLACKKATEEVDGIIALGVIVQGATHHADEIARACTDGIMQVQVETDTPIAHEVLYVDSLEDAKERTIGEKNKGEEAALTLLSMMNLMKEGEFTKTH